MEQPWRVTACFFALLLLNLYGAHCIIASIITALTWAAILAIPAHPFCAWKLKKLRAAVGIMLGPARFARLRALFGLYAEEQAKPAETD